MISELGFRVLRPILNGKATVLEALTIKLLDVIHLEILKSSKLAKLFILSKSFPVIKSAVSSAKNLGVLSKPVPKLAPPEHPNRGGPRTKRGPRK